MIINTTGLALFSIQKNTVTIGLIGFFCFAVDSPGCWYLFIVWCAVYTMCSYWWNIFIVW